eukprot:evm.model.scf_1521.3 EVM.evm.TU.scf_1521.3   scf_1521:24872-32424(-)
MKGERGRRWEGDERMGVLGGRGEEQGGRGGSRVAEEERERERQLEAVRSLTRHVGVQDAMKSLDPVCQNLKNSMKKLDKTWRLTKKTRPGIRFEDCHDLVQQSQRIFAGLRAVHAVSGTGVGRSQNLVPAREVMRAAKNYRHILFSSTQKKELENWVRLGGDMEIVERGRDQKEGERGSTERKERRRGRNRDEAQENARRHTPPPPPPPSSPMASDQKRHGASNSRPTSASSVSKSSLTSHLDSGNPQSVDDNVDCPSPMLKDALDVRCKSRAVRLASKGLPAVKAACEGGQPKSFGASPCAAVVSSPLGLESTSSPDARAAGAKNDMHETGNGDQDPVRRPTEGKTDAKGPGPARVDKGKRRTEELTRGKRAQTGCDAAEQVVVKKMRHSPLVRSAIPPVGQDFPDPGATPLTGVKSPPEGAVAPGQRPVGDNGDALTLLEDMEEPVTPPSTEDTRAQASCLSGGGQVFSRPVSPGLRTASWNSGACKGGKTEGRWDQSHVPCRLGGLLGGGTTKCLSENGGSVVGHGVAHSGLGGCGTNGGDMEVVDALSKGKLPNVSVAPHQWDSCNTDSRPADMPFEDRRSEPSPSGLQGPCSLSAPSPPGAAVSGRAAATSSGQFRSDKENSRVQIAEGKAVPAARADVDALLKERRLCLVLDLDHTLLNSCKFSEAGPGIAEVLNTKMLQEEHRVPEEKQLFKLPKLGLWTKLRPGLREFLNRAKGSFELWIHTSGSRAYGNAMRALIDPSGQLFGDRLIAQGGAGDDKVAQPKTLRNGLEGRESLVLILDDSTAVWPREGQNLLSVERYLFFPSSRRQLGMPGQSLLEINHDESAPEGMLMTALKVLLKVHARFFRSQQHGAPVPKVPGMPPTDVRRIMDEERSLVLDGVHIVFSRIIPLEQRPENHPLWRLARQFGATCSPSFNAQTTHVIAVVSGTEKVFWARQNSRYVVNPNW